MGDGDTTTTTTNPYQIPTGGDAAAGNVSTADAGGEDTEGLEGADFGGMGMDEFVAALVLASQPKQPEGPEEAQPITGEAWGDRAWGIDQTPPVPWYSAGDPGGEAGDLWDKRFRRGDIEGQRTSQYSTEDPLNTLNDMTTPQLAALELQFIQAGLIDEDAYLNGQRGPLIADFGSLMVQADHNRISWEDQLDQNITAYEQWKKDNPEEKPKTWAQNNPFIAPVFVKPDYATLAQGSKATMRQMLGRTPTSSEMKLLTTQLGSDYQAEWQSEVYDKSKMSWEAASRAHEADATSATTGSVQGVDPEARFAERFEDRYENELEHRERVDTSERKSANLFSSIDTISRMTS